MHKRMPDSDLTSRSIRDELLFLQENPQNDSTINDDDDTQTGEPAETVSGGHRNRFRSRGKQKIRIEFMADKNRRYSTFSKRKTGLMKKACELSQLTGAEVLLLVASETNHVYTFATPKLKSMIDSEKGRKIIQTCLCANNNGANNGNAAFYDTDNNEEDEPESPSDQSNEVAFMGKSASNAAAMQKVLQQFEQPVSSIADTSSTVPPPTLIPCSPVPSVAQQSSQQIFMTSSQVQQSETAPYIITIDPKQESTPMTVQLPLGASSHPTEHFQQPQTHAQQPQATQTIDVSLLQSLIDQLNKHQGSNMGQQIILQPTNSPQFQVVSRDNTSTGQLIMTQAAPFSLSTTTQNASTLDLMSVPLSSFGLSGSVESLSSGNLANASSQNRPISVQSGSSASVSVSHLSAIKRPLTSNQPIVKGSVIDHTVPLKLPKT